MDHNTKRRSDLAREKYLDLAEIRKEHITFGKMVFTVEELLTGEGSRFVSIHSPDIISSLSVGASLCLSELISRELKYIVGDIPKNLAVIGLGNREMAADRLGVRTAELISPTRSHSSLEGIFVMIPGVEGSTGISAFEAASAMFAFLKPDAAIVIDSLAAASADHLGKTVQISNAGISPGSGLGKRTHRLDSSTLAVPVYSVGVPTVISAENLIFGDGINGEDLYVSLSQTDAVAESASRIIASALERTFLPD